MLKIEKKFAFGGDFKIWHTNRIEVLGNPVVWLSFDSSSWNEITEIDNSANFKEILDWTDETISYFDIVLNAYKKFDIKKKTIIDSIDFPAENESHISSIILPFPFFYYKQFVKMGINAESFEKGFVFNITTKEVFTVFILKYLTKYSTMNKFLFCLLPDLKKVECFDIFQGQQEVWHYDFEAEGYEVLKNEPPAQYLDMLLFMVQGKEGADTLAIDSQTGKKRWCCEMGYLPDVSCTYKGNLVSYRGIWYNDVVHINPQTGEIMEHWHLPDWVTDYPTDMRGQFTIDKQNLYLAPKNYVGLDHEFYEGKGVLVFSLETHELVQELPCKINMECKKIEKVGKRLFVHDHGNLHIFVEE